MMKVCENDFTFSIFLFYLHMSYIVYMKGFTIIIKNSGREAGRRVKVAVANGGTLRYHIYWDSSLNPTAYSFYLSSASRVYR
jgi:hypothetical protein